MYGNEENIARIPVSFQRIICLDSARLLERVVEAVDQERLAATRCSPEEADMALASTLFSTTDVEDDRLYFSARPKHRQSQQSA